MTNSAEFQRKAVWVKHLHEYVDAYNFLAIRRVGGILEVRFHSDQGPLVWSQIVHQQLPMAFADIAADPSNRVVILTGTGDEFIDRRAPARAVLGDDVPDTGWSHHDRLSWESDRILRNLLDVQAPIIAAVNGPARVHAELALLSDIVLAADTAVFGDTAHLADGVVPGDGVHFVWPMLLGHSRARQLLWGVGELSAEEAHQIGVVGEVLSPSDLLDRAWEHANRLVEMPRLTLRYTRELLTRPFKRALLDELGYGLALEGIGVAAAKAEARLATSPNERTTAQ